MIKTYELIIDQARDDEITWIRAKGFWTQEQMIQAAHDQNWYHVDTDRKFMNHQQGYYKTVPTRDGCLYIPCDKSVRGSYPCTYVEVQSWQDDTNTLHASRQIKANLACSGSYGMLIP